MVASASCHGAGLSPGDVPRLRIWSGIARKTSDFHRWDCPNFSPEYFRTGDLTVHMSGTQEPRTCKHLRPGSEQRDTPCTSGQHAPSWSEEYSAQSGGGILDGATAPLAGVVKPATRYPAFHWPAPHPRGLTPRAFCRSSDLNRHPSQPGRPSPGGRSAIELSRHIRCGEENHLKLPAVRRKSLSVDDTGFEDLLPATFFGTALADSDCGRSRRHGSF